MTYQQVCPLHRCQRGPDLRVIPAYQLVSNNLFVIPTYQQVCALHRRQRGLDLRVQLVQELGERARRVALVHV